MEHCREADARLLAAWDSKRDEAAFHQLCERHAGLVAATCRRLGAPDADEATQAVFLVLARRAGAVDGRGLAGWLIGVTRRVVATQRRQAAIRHRHEEAAAMEHVRAHATPPTGASWSDAREQLDVALASLSTGRREALVRFYLQGKPQAEVAAELGCSPDAVKTRVHEGLERLRAFFARRGVVLSAAALISGLAGEAAANEPALAAACAQGAAAPSFVPHAAALAQETATAMVIKSFALASVAALIAGSALTATLVLAAESAADSAPPAAVALPAPQVIVVSDIGDNAALPWWRAMEEMPEQNDPIWEAALRMRLPAKAADALFAGPVPSLDLLALGTTCMVCDWGLDTKQEGVIAPAPHIGKLRVLIRLGILRARWYAQRGDLARATAQVVVCVRAARLSVNRGPRVRAMGFAQANESYALDALASFLPRLSADQRKQLGQDLLRPAAPPLSLALIKEARAVDWTLTRLAALPYDARLDELGLPATPPADLDPTDANLALCRTAVASELARWQAHLDASHADILKPLIPRFAGTGAAGSGLPAHNASPADLPGSNATTLLARLFTIDDQAVALEVRLREKFQQMLAALAILERGDAGLGEWLDPLSGKPFTLERSGTSFSLSAGIPGDPRHTVLVVGDPPAAKDTPVVDF